MARESRLESFIHRIMAQRACLNYAALLIRGLGGPVIELGLGNGRTYDHLRSLFPERDIYVFERRIEAHPDCVPDPQHAIVGDFRVTMPNALARIGRRAAFIHGDFGSADKAKTAALARWLGPRIAELAAAGAIIATDQALDAPGLEPIPLPAAVSPGRYFMYRAQPVPARHRPTPVRGRRRAPTRARAVRPRRRRGRS